MENKQNIPQVGKVTLFKLRVSKVISGQTTGGFSVIISLKKRLIRDKVEIENVEIKVIK